MNWRKALLLSMVVGASGAAQAADVAETPIGEPTERHIADYQPVGRWVHDPEALDALAGDRLETRQVTGEAFETVKLTGLVPPIRFESGVADIPAGYVRKLEEILETMRDRRNVRLHFVGHADSQPLSDALVRVYGDNQGLSRERAGEVAEFFKVALSLPPEAISFEWAGETQPIATNATEAGRALNRRVEVEVWYDQPHEKLVDEQVLVTEDFKRIKVCRVETVCKLRYVEGHARRARVRNLVTPLHYESDSIGITAEFQRQMTQALANLAGKQNLRVRFIGYTDDTPLTGRTEAIYGDHLALSKARAHRVALAMQEALDLPGSEVESDGRGAQYPVASNDTPQGRSLNRRVEVEFWYDDPLQELPDEPQLCPADSGDELVTRVYDPPWGRIDSLELDGGRAVVPAGYTETLRRAMNDISDRRNVRLRFIGYTANERLDRRTAMVYGDDIGLSASRARRAMDTVAAEMQLDPSQVEHEGRGYVQSDDVVATGFIAGERSFVRVQVVYDEPAPLDDLDGIDVTRLTREIAPKSPYELNLMRITVDGEPIDDPNRSSADIQRCTDVALDKADIELSFDNLRSKPRLSVAAAPDSIGVMDGGDGQFAGEPVQFRAYANYGAFISRAEVRIFAAGESVQGTPLQVLPVDDTGSAVWHPVTERFAGSKRELQYVLRTYDARGNFDETRPQQLWLVHRDATTAETPAESATDDRLLAAYGESSLAVRNIRLGSGTVTVRGRDVPTGYQVWVAGQPVPVDPAGNFVAETILPSGAQSVEIAMLDADGNGTLFLRDLEFKRNDWFYVGLADLTASEGSTSGAARAQEGANAPRDLNSSLDGRLAFYVDGKFGDHWRLTASADTREGPVDELFSNLLDKSPDSLFRRIDPDYHYPTFGDDSVVDEMAPTMGKFFVRLSQGENFGQWGNFKVGYRQNELAQVDRGLYGANAHYESDTTTSFGEQRYAIDGFVAEPGTVASYEEFRGTGGSLYYLRRQDILAGSESLRIELRDKDSQIVVGVVNLRPSVDYDIDYLQGRVLLTEPLSARAADNLLVRNDGLSGQEAFLVVRYEYTPGFDELDALAGGGQAHVWVNDRVKLGLTTSTNDDGDTDSSLHAADVTVRMSSESWVKLQAGRSEGQVSATTISQDGGFTFADDAGSAFFGGSADAYRLDVSVGISDLFASQRGRVTLYTQSLGAGYSAPGQNTATDTDIFGGVVDLPLGERLSLRAKADFLNQQDGLETSAQELDVGYQVSSSWRVSTGLRNDTRRDYSPVVPATQEEGDRTDAVVQVGYDPGGAWSAYGFVQDTLASTGNRGDNSRIGTGGSYRFGDRLTLDAEVSDGDLGPGGRLGTNYLLSERTNLYLNYTLENERTDNGLAGRRGNLVSGVKRRFSDSTSVYLEERYQDTEALEGLTHATGISLVANERWNLGANADFGILTNARTGAETDRKAGGVRVGYGRDSVQMATAVEYRYDQTEQLDTTYDDRRTWLFRTTLRYQLNPDWRVIGKINYSNSDSSQGAFYDGGYTEAVLGYAYRPVANDRLNALAKYTYFYNVPSTDQLTAQDVSAEFIQKSHVVAVDVGYDLNASWSVGGKYAFRLGSVSLDREDPRFFDNGAQLVVVRTDWRFVEHWEGTVEARMLELPDVDQRRSGALVTVSRAIGEHLKVGLGYNFTDFSDDLTDLSYDHQGFFLNLVGTL